MLIHGGTKPPVVGPPESSMVQVAPRSLDRATNSGPWSTLVAVRRCFEVAARTARLQTV